MEYTTRLLMNGIVAFVIGCDVINWIIHSSTQRNHRSKHPTINPSIYPSIHLTIQPSKQTDRQPVRQPNDKPANQTTNDDNEQKRTIKYDIYLPKSTNVYHRID